MGERGWRARGGLRTSNDHVRPDRRSRWPARVLVAYATNHGHTGRIAQHVAEVLRRDGLTADEARASTSRCVEELVERTGWKPDRVACVAGAIQYREYDLPTRVLMRLIARHHHASTDVSQDLDLTDWAAVERFGEQFAGALRPAGVDDVR